MLSGPAAPAGAAAGRPEYGQQVPGIRRKL